ncbi:tyrosine-type recombinase/integrase [Paraburkholderia nemoris]|uniref:tyrosine-type recombinase/integrase n=1 Tax=Paraburkholderia nemoris TaxID=2793076 RepID=UPI001F401C94|nr:MULTISPECIES: tyrosine-type recombinase/integrase [Paraburkholderia]
MSRAEIQAILGAPDLSTSSGRRDHTMLLTMYNTGARVSEITSMTCTQVELGIRSSFVHLYGKGRNYDDLGIMRSFAPRTLVCPSAMAFHH